MVRIRRICWIGEWEINKSFGHLPRFQGPGLKFFAGKVFLGRLEHKGSLGGLHRCN